MWGSQGEKLAKRGIETTAVTQKVQQKYRDIACKANFFPPYLTLDAENEDILVQIQEEQRQFPRRFARRLHQVGKSPYLRQAAKIYVSTSHSVVRQEPIEISEQRTAFVCFFAQEVDRCMKNCDR